MRVCSCCEGGNAPTSRSTVRVAPSVWSVASTKCPVSAAVSASEIVSVSRSSPITITSGSSRSAPRSARANDSVCLLTWRWFTMQRRDGWRYSIGSSIVSMCSARSSLIRLTSAASVAVLPQRVGPVISTIPWW